MLSPVWPLPIYVDSWAWHSRFQCNIVLTVSNFTSITSHIHNWVLFLLWLHLFILSGVISPLFSSSLLGTYQPREFIFQCPVFLTFHTVLGILKARMLKWFAIPLSSEPHFFRTLHCDPSVLGGFKWHASYFHWVREGCSPCDQFDSFYVMVVFILSALWWIRVRGLWKLPRRGWPRGKLGLVLMGRAMLSKSLIQFSLDGWGSVLSLFSDLRPNYSGDNEDNDNLLQKAPCQHCYTRCPQPCSQPPLTHASTGGPWTLLG